jgi:hypothetical protein
MPDYYEVFDDTRAGMLGALERAVTEAHAWDFLRYWEPEWEMVPLPSIEQRLPNLDAYEPEIYSDCVDIIWTIARTDWPTFRESYITQNPPCSCRARAGKAASNCWPRYPAEGEPAMCDEIRDYRLITPDNQQATRLEEVDRVITARGDWEFWSIGAPENWRLHANIYGVRNLTSEDMHMISEIADMGWDRFVGSRNHIQDYLDQWGVPREVD